MAMKNVKGAGCTGGAFYGLGLIGAAVYFVQHGVGVWGVILGLLKAIVWPAFIAYHLLDFFKI